MRGVVLAPQWARNPPAGVQINWGHPLARGLAFCALPTDGAPHDLVSGLVALTAGSSPTRNPSAIGNTWKFSGSNAWYYTSSTPKVAALDAVSSGRNSYFCWVQRPAVGAKVFAEWDDAGHTRWMLNPQTNGSVWYFTNGPAIQPGSGTLRASPAMNLIGMTYDGTVLRGYMNGVLDGSVTAVWNSGPSAPITIGAGANGVPTIDGQLTGLLGPCMVWSRALTPGEIRSLYQNPYQFLIPPSAGVERFWTSVSSTTSPGPVYTPRRRPPRKPPYTGPLWLGTQEPYGAPAGATQNMQTFTAGLSFTGSLTKSTTKSLSGGLSFTGSLLKAIVKTAFIAVLSFTGALFNQTTKALGAGLSFSGALARATVKTLLAGLSFTGKLFKAAVHGLTAALSFTGNLFKTTVKTAFTAVLSFTGGFVKGLAHILTFTATLSFAGSFQRATTKALAGVLSFTGAIKRAATKTLAGVLSFGGSLLKATVKTPFTAALNFTGSMLKGVGKKLTGGLSFTGTFSSTKAHPSPIPDICPPTVLALAIPSSTLDIEGPITTGLDLEIANSTVALTIPTSTAAMAIPNSTSALAIPNSTANLTIPTTSLDMEIPTTTLDLESC